MLPMPEAAQHELPPVLSIQLCTHHRSLALQKLDLTILWHAAGHLQPSRQAAAT